ncbi:chitooligosaccharidolytic beta-N-acetylglucosaminidase-like [Cotesia typhae]|uniref:chitooligosaccharidolytic beta-N-acetylglucosaminidase-like n=1 Tax=Cotesia typhae TaxID=2053667 RepID=UPI003D680494
MIYIVFITLALQSFVEAQFSSPWHYECKNNRCKKSELTPEVISPRSLEACQLLCGTGSLLPIPTGDVSLGNSLGVINRRKIKLTHLSHPESKIGQLLKVKVHALRRNVNKLGRNVNRLEQNEGCSLQIRIRGLSDNRTTLRLDTKESYSLKIHQYKSSSIQVIIKGQSYFGVRNGLETLSQLIVFNELTNQFQVASNVSILDAPMYPYRGILLDTSRNFISKATILRTIEAMGMSKLNSFHWHLSDSQSFPYISRTWPNMSRYGAYSPKKTYSSEDIKEIVDFGIHHGVRVVPELDAPGHVGEGWQWAGEDTLSCFRAQPWTKFCQEPPCGQLNPVSDKVYVLLDGLYQDLLEDFRPEIFHMGGDEVKTSCWASSESIRTWMTNQDWSLDDAGFMKLWMYFQQLAFKKLNSGEKKIKKAVLWTSSLTDEEYLKFLDPKKYIIQIWTDIYDSTIRRLLENDFQVIFSNYDALYLDCGVEAWIGEGSNWCSPYKGWKKIYNNSPLNIARHHGVENKTHLILGGEAALWTEQTDSVSVDPRLWPRSAALAERLWAEPETSWRNFEQRMLFHRERLVKRGIRADSLEPEWCRINQGLC